MKVTWTELDNAILRNNLLLARQALQPGVGLYLVVKANAYGHGLAEVAGCAARAGVSGFAVAHMEEAVALRAMHPRATILVLCVPPPDAAAQFLKHHLVPMIAGPEHGAALVAELRRLRPHNPLPCHVKIDTGMSRLGFDWRRAAADLSRLAREPELALCGIASHFASAGEIPDQAERQFRRFVDVVRDCAKSGVNFAQRHISASAGFMHNPSWDLDGVRLGILMYGYPAGPERRRINVRPPMQWKTRVLQVKTLPRGRTVGYGQTYALRRAGRIAILGAGYADGYDRRLGNRGAVIIDGCRCPVVGRISMNLTTVSLPPACRVRAGDEAVLIGCQGRAAIWADELADLCETIPYDILTAIRH